jgi:hypothetical protein
MNVQSSRRGDLNMAVDVGLGLSLVMALAVVFGIDRAVEKPKPIERPDAGELVVIEHRPGEKESPTQTLQLGVTPQRNNPEVKVWDDMGKLLDSLGEGYKYTSFDPNDLRDIHKLEPYSIIFLTCSTAPHEWLDLEHPLGSGDRPGTTAYRSNKQVSKEIARSVREWVERGGTLYASDKHFDIVEEAFPEFVDRSVVDSPAEQDVEAEVVDSGLKEAIGPHVKLKFDQPGWRPAAFGHESLTVYLKGGYRADGAGQRKIAPLLVKFPVNKGNVIFTSFHNEKQNSETEMQLLRYLVFTTLQAKVESQLEKAMQFKPQQSSLLSSSPEKPSATLPYHKEQSGSMQITLGFNNVGATLRLTVIAPNGKRYKKDLTSSIVLEIADADAPPGDWTIMVDAVSLPYPNFPFSISVGQKQ